MTEQIDLLEKSIISKLPQIPYIIDQVGSAMNWRKDEVSLGNYTRVLKMVDSLCDYVHIISEGNFYRTHLIIAALLMDIPDVMNNEKFGIFKTASQAVERTLSELIIPNDNIEERGVYRALIMRMSVLSRDSEDSFAILLFKLKSVLEEILSGMKKVSVKAPITLEDNNVVLGIALIMANLRMTDMKILDCTRTVLNDIEILLNTNFNY